MLAGRPLGIASCIIRVGTRKFTAARINNAKNIENSNTPFCHTISVVISPKGFELNWSAQHFIFRLVDEVWK
jgi:hypothetical protein